jgi:hypothetical protein
MKVPDGLPSSFQYEFEDEGWVCHVKLYYTVGASISAGIRDTTDLIIHQRLGLPIYETSMLRSADVRFCCSKQGQATTSIQLSSPAYYLGDTIPLTLKYDFSNCKKSPLSFEVELKYKLRLMIHPGHYKHNRGKLSTARANCEAKEGTIEFALKTAEMGNKICTMLSTNITCEFFLVVSPKFGCCVSAGDLSCQIMVLMSSKFPNIIITAPPPDWNPVVLQPAFIEPLHQPPATQPQPPETKPYSDHPSTSEVSRNA